QDLVKIALTDGWAPGDSPFEEVTAAIMAVGQGPVDQNALSEPARTLYAAAANGEMLPENQALELARLRINRVRRESLNAEGRRLEEAIRAADAQKDPARVLELTRRRIELRQQM